MLEALERYQRHADPDAKMDAAHESAAALLDACEFVSPNMA